MSDNRLMRPLACISILALMPCLAGCHAASTEPTPYVEEQAPPALEATQTAAVSIPPTVTPAPIATVAEANDQLIGEWVSVDGEIALIFYENGRVRVERFAIYSIGHYQLIDDDTFRIELPGTDGSMITYEGSISGDTLQVFGLQFTQ
jgi:hypothetical protein